MTTAKPPFRVDDVFDADSGRWKWIVVDAAGTLLALERSEVAARGVVLRLEREARLANEKSQ